MYVYTDTLRKTNRCELVFTLQKLYKKYSLSLSVYSSLCPSLPVLLCTPLAAGITHAPRLALMNSINKVPHKPIHYVHYLSNKASINSTVPTNAAAINLNIL